MSTAPCARPTSSPSARVSRRHILWVKRRLAPIILMLVPILVAAQLGESVTQALSPSATLPTGFVEALVDNGLNNPTSMAFAPDGRLFVTQQGGALRVIKDGALLATPFLSLTVDSFNERGLLGVAFDPDFANNNFLYVYYTVPAGAGNNPPPHNRLSRFTANGDVAVAGSEEKLLELDDLTAAGNHNGGALHFGKDGKLYIAVGENANSANAQTLNNLLGKLLRLNSDGSIPGDNPFYATASGKNRAIWAMGLRNPFTFDIQPGTGKIFINDVGQNTWEEINEGVAGANYGWPTCEGFCSPAQAALTDPLYTYSSVGSSQSDPCAITGGTFYNPAVQQFPSSYVGKYFFADYCKGFIKLLDPASGTATDFASGIAKPVDLDVGPDGSLYYLARDDNSVFKIMSGQAPAITQHPVSQTITIGHAVTFKVSASGELPLSYQWQRNGSNIPGATLSSYTISETQAADNGATFRCRVSNSKGNVTSNSATLTITTSTPPTATITLPAEGTRYTAGELISYAGSASDAEDGILPASSMSWEVVFHHDTHTHPFLPASSGAVSGTFMIPTIGETSPNVWYRIHLTVTDTVGLINQTYRDVYPHTTTLVLRTSPAGLVVTLDGQQEPTPLPVAGVSGIERSLGVVSPQTINGTTYEFVGWTNGGTATHDIIFPSEDTSYMAVFRQTAPIQANPYQIKLPLIAIPQAEP